METRPHNLFNWITFLSVQYRISFPNGWKHQRRKKSKRHLDWSFGDVPERWSCSNKSWVLYDVYADGNCGLFFSNTGKQVTLPFKYWENKTFTSRSETHNIRQLEHWSLVCICLSCQEIKTVVRFILLCHLWFVVWYPIRGDLPEILKKFPLSLKYVWDIQEIPLIQGSVPEILKNFPSSRNCARDIQEFSSNM